MVEEDRGRTSFNIPSPEEHFGPEDTEEKRSFKGLGVKCLYLYRNRRLLGHAEFVAG